MADNSTRLGPLTTLRQGTLGDYPNAERDGMFVNPSTALGLRGRATAQAPVPTGEIAPTAFSPSFEMHGQYTRRTRAGTSHGDAARRRSRGG
jgi:hypothetical protein